jgi:hypothetical protein
MRLSRCSRSILRARSAGSRRVRWKRLRRRLRRLRIRQNIQLRIQRRQIRRQRNRRLCGRRGRVANGHRLDGHLRNDRLLNGTVNGLVLTDLRRRGIRRWRHRTTSCGLKKRRRLIFCWDRAECPSCRWRRRCRGRVEFRIGRGLRGGESGEDGAERGAVRVAREERRAACRREADWRGVDRRRWDRRNRHLRRSSRLRLSMSH